MEEKFIKFNYQGRALVAFYIKRKNPKNRPYIEINIYEFIAADTIDELTPVPVIDDSPSVDPSLWVFTGLKIVDALKEHIAGLIRKYDQ